MTAHMEESAQALKTALQMEEEGKEFYLKSQARSDNALAKMVFGRLAEEEDVHYAKVGETYQAVASRQKWPETETVFKHEKSLRAVFRKAIRGMSPEVEVASSELEAIQTAMKMEDRSYSFYSSRDREAESPAEKAFYQALMAEERTHYLALVDSYEYLSDPQGWFTKTERWSLDGQ